MNADDRSRYPLSFYVGWFLVGGGFAGNGASIGHWHWGLIDWALAMILGGAFLIWRGRGRAD